MTREILAVTGIRSEYNILYPALSELERRDETTIGVAATGAHVAGQHDDTLSYIADDGFGIVDTVATLYADNEEYLRSKGVGEIVSESHLNHPSLAKRETA